MTQEEKQLLLIELCARMPHNVTCQFTWTYCNETTNGEEVIAKENDNIRDIDIHTKEVRADYYDEWVDLEHCKPYLRPLSSMTEEEYKELKGICSYYGFGLYEFIGDWCPNYDMVDWCNKNHFDYRGLIPMGLALEAPENMYNTK